MIFVSNLDRSINMSSLTPSKRPHHRNSKESNGKKFQKLASDDTQKQPRKTSSSAVFRVLCPSSKVGSVIGEGDNIILQIRQETGAKVRVDDAIPGCDERVIFIMCPDREDESGSEEIKSENDDAKCAQEQAGSKDQDGNVVDKETLLTPEDPPSDKESSCVQKALFLVFDKILEGEKETEGGDGEKKWIRYGDFESTCALQSSGLPFGEGWLCHQTNVC